MVDVSNWRATYAPGRWVVLAGPTSLVIMQPAPAHMSDLLSDLWHDVVSAADVADLAAKFAAFRLDLMPHFAAFFWTGDGMHSLIRGALRAVDAETGDVLATGEGFHTWNEVGLGGVRQVRVEMEPEDTSETLQLPLAVGVVLASSITVDSSAKIPLVLPTVAAAPAVGPDDATEVIAEAPADTANEEATEVIAAETVTPTDEGPQDAPAPVVPPLALVVPLPEQIDVPEVDAPAPDVPDEMDSPAAEVAPLAVVPVVAEESLPIQYDAEPFASQAEPQDAAQHESEPTPDETPAEVEQPVDDHVEEAPPADEPQPVEAPQSPEDEQVPEEHATYEQEPAPAWPSSEQPVAHDAWGVEDAAVAAPVDLFVDEDGDGVPDAPRSDLDLQESVPDVQPSPVPLVVPEAPPAPGFPGFPGAQVAQNQGGFLPGPIPAPAAPPGPPWNQAPQDRFGQGFPGPAAQPAGQPYGAQPFGGQPMPGQGFQGFPPPMQGQPFGGQPQGQPYPGQPQGQPYPGQQPPQPGPYSPQQPVYPPNGPYGQQPSPSAQQSPVPPPAYAPLAPQPQPPGAPAERGLPSSQESADTGDSTVFSTGIAMTHKPVAPRSGGDSLVLAVVCALGHPNPQGIAACRVCRQPVDNANPRLVHRPVLAQLVTAGGARVELTDAVLIGRAPAAQAGDGNPILLPVPSPNSDISRTHLRVAVRNWEIIATDLHSTNGTMVVRPGQPPVRMVPGSPVTVEPGTILDLGDGGVITVGLPA